MPKAPTEINRLGPLGVSFIFNPADLNFKIDYFRRCFLFQLPDAGSIPAISTILRAAKNALRSSLERSMDKVMVIAINNCCASNGTAD
jgi:hypothetical protein